MKYPKKLSPERLSLLTPKERFIYESEHPEDFGKEPLIQDIEETSDNYSLFDEEDDFDGFFDKKELAKVNEALQHTDEVLDSFVNGVIQEHLNAIFEDFVNDVDKDTLNEMKNVSAQMLTEEDFTIEDELNETDNLLVEGAEGYDAGEWVRGITAPLGFFGKLLGAGLAGIAGGIGYLVAAGLHKKAVAKLKRYMNKIVEIVDQGMHKKKPWLSFLLPKKRRQNTGEYNSACFRFRQEAAERDMCVNVMNVAQKMGYFNEGSMMQISSGAAPQEGGGLSMFYHNVVEKIKIMDSGAGDN